jgi:GNAT superfamily N-acetyltransferase
MAQAGKEGVVELGLFGALLTENFNPEELPKKKQKEGKQTMIEIKKVNTPSLRKAFLKLQHELYKDSAKWVPMFKRDAKKLSKGEGSLIFDNGPHELFVALKDEQVVGRVAVGIEEVLNKRKEYKHAYFTLFESINDEEVAKALLDTCLKWAKEHGMIYLKGPVSPTNGDDYRGLLVEGYDKPPAVLMPYHHEYYKRFFDEYDKYLEYWAYEYNLENPVPQKSLQTMKKIAALYGKYPEDEINKMNEEQLGAVICEVIFEKKGYRAEQANLKTKKHTQQVIDDVYTIMNESYPDIWEEDLVAPTKEEVREMVKELKIVIDPGMGIIAKKDGKPVGVILAVPDINKGIKRAKGKILPTGWYHILKSKKNTKIARGVILFVIKEYQKQGVPAFLFLKLRENLKRLGYKKIELSSISAMNDTMNGVYQWLELKVIKHYMVFGRSVSGEALSLEEIYGHAADKVRAFREKHSKNAAAV